MRITLLLWVVGMLLGLGSRPASHITERNFQPYFDQFGVQGSLLLYDEAAGQYTAHNLPRCRQGFLPASTFKIPNTLIGLQTGALPDTATVCRWDGRQRSFPQWNQDMSYAQALRVSCVPCYQQLARRIGVPAYHRWLRRLRYPGMVVTPATLDTFWLDGNSRITQFEQVDFLRRLYAEKLPVDGRHQRAVKQLFVLQKTAQYTFCGKTGWRFHSATNPDNGWLVGWLTHAGGRTIFFALNLEPQNGQPAGPQFAACRRTIVELALKELSWM